MKNYGDLGGCYPPRNTALTDNTLLDLHNTLFSRMVICPSILVFE